MAGVLGVAALLIDRLGQRVRVLHARTQRAFADFPQRASERILAAVERVEQDPREGAGERVALIARSRGRVALLADRDPRAALHVLDRGAVALDQLIAALDEHLRDEHQQQRVAADRRQPCDLPRRAAFALKREHPHPARCQHREIGLAGAEPIQVQVLLDLAADRRGRAAVRRRSEPLKPGHPSGLAQLQQPVTLARPAALKLRRELLVRCDVRSLSRCSDHAYERVDGRADDPLGEQVLAAQLPQRLRALVLDRSPPSHSSSSSRRA